MTTQERSVVSVDAKNQRKRNNTELAKLAGYAPESAYQRGYENTTHKIKPHVVQRIEELKEDFRIRNQITPDKHMARLNQLGRKAESEKMLGVAVNAEVYRGKMAGYYVEKKLIANQTIDDLSEEQLEEKMKKIADQFELLERNPNDKR
jgi:phage terminase small subunit